MYIFRIFVQTIFQLRREKTNILYMRKQRHRSALQYSTFILAIQIGQFLYFLNLKFPASSYRLCFYSSVCVGPVQKPHCWYGLGQARGRLDKRIALVAGFAHTPCTNFDDSSEPTRSISALM